MKRFKVLLSSIWKQTDRARNKGSLNPLILLFYRIVAKSIRSTWKFMDSSQKTFTLSIFGVLLKRRVEDFTYQFCLLGYCGTFLSDEIEQISKPTVFIDVGANIGLFTILAAQNAYVEQVYAFDPDESTIPYLEENIAINKCANVTVFPYAVSTEAGTNKLYIEEGHSGASSMIPTDRTNFSYEITSINEEFLDINLVVHPASEVFVKIDVEGHEASVLTVLQKWSRFRAVTKIFLEFDIDMSNVGELQDTLKDAGFHSQRKVGTSKHWDELFVRNS